MTQDRLHVGESRSVLLRRLLVPDWLWQLTWLRHFPRYLRSAKQAGCSKSTVQILRDLLHLFFKLRTVPEHYHLCQLWDVPKKDWILYCGTPYTPVTWGRIAKRLYPFEYTILYNDKVVGAQLCKSLPVRQPIIYGTVDPAPDFRHRLAAIFQSSGQRQLMLKPLFGRSGIGIVLLEQREQHIIARAGDREIPLADLQLDGPVFLQEVIRQHPQFAAVWNSSVNTMRIITLQTISGDIIFLGGLMRFGVGKSVVDNWSAGGVAAGIDMDTGRLRSYAGDQHGIRYAKHPSSQFTFDGFQIPHWQSILDAARTIQRELPFSKIAGLDLCLDEAGNPVLIEINGLPDWTMPEQMSGPLLANPRILKAFSEYGLLTGPQKRLVAS